ncbi:MAG: inositol-3-phosphate synthase [Planctomycetes bacterium]|nr:inositol-3-phosphate synthase [Planctomycetota bacterium]
MWLFGGLGGLATTVVVGARALARGLCAPRGLVSETELAAGLPLCGLDQLVFGGHEVREGTPAEAAREIDDAQGTLRRADLRRLAGDLRAYGAELRTGCLPNPGRTIARLADRELPTDEPLRAQVDRLCRDLDDFRARNRLDTVVCVNLTSTEPKLRLGKAHRSTAAFDRELDADRRAAVRPSTLYAYAAARLGLPFVHFTPSNAALIPAVREMFDERGVPYAGCDGKTGETLVKSALAAMFRYRDLRVLTWQGYNMLGDRDGAVLADAENKASKVESKDRLLSRILGHELHTHVAIDFVPSLGDMKTAWDFVHFEGFLGVRMAMQFTWQGCDAILAAPLVLDLVRFLDLARRRGEGGAQTWLACYFKSPLDVDEHDLHRQWDRLAAWLAACRDA